MWPSESSWRNSSKAAKQSPGPRGFTRVRSSTEKHHQHSRIVMWEPVRLTKMGRWFPYEAPVAQTRCHSSRLTAVDIEGFQTHSRRARIPHSVRVPLKAVGPFYDLSWIDNSKIQVNQQADIRYASHSVGNKLSWPRRERHRRRHDRQF